MCETVPRWCSQASVRAAVGGPVATCRSPRVGNRFSVGPSSCTLCFRESMMAAGLLGEELELNIPGRSPNQAGPGSPAAAARLPVLITGDMRLVIHGCAL
jgi:hypothetical protein